MKYAIKHIGLTGFTYFLLASWIVLETSARLLWSALNRTVQGKLLCQQFKQWKSRPKNFMVFLHAWMNNPRSIGAILPSSRYLAREMAMQVNVDRPGFVIELGPGTGVVTAALIQRGVDPSRIIALENDAELVKVLKQRFPRIAVRYADACQLQKVLGPAIPITAVVSSLPLRSLPKQKVVQMVEGLARILPKDVPFVQFTYSFFGPLSALKQFKRQYGKRVWRNFPPAKVEVFKADHCLHNTTIPA
jgi:phosphatidylethanolamine/phosphatidyl-N-methylethanolamine N-methyltransferase